MLFNARNRGLFCFFAGLFALGCASRSVPDSPAADAALVDANLVPQENYFGIAIECPAALPEVADEDGKAWYAIEGMTRMLRRFPSFAAYAGLEQVDTCDEAIAYVHAYHAYSANHPNFEAVPDPLLADQPLGAEGQLLPRLKIRNGQLDTDAKFPDKPSPVVRLRAVHFYTDGTGQPWTKYCDKRFDCSGTMIAKNVILTAAHCLQSADKNALKKGEVCPLGGLPAVPGHPAFKGDSTWLLQWATDQTAEVPDSHLSLYLDLDQYPYPGFNGKNFEDGDFGLLHIREEYDNRLPPDISLGAAAWLNDYLSDSVPPLPADFPMRMAGYGAWVVGGVEKDPNPLTSVALPHPEKLHRQLYYDIYRLPTSEGEDSTCEGDSGGPLYRAWTTTIQDLKRGKTYNATRMSIYGVASRTTYYDLDAGAPRCPRAGDKEIWARVDCAEIRDWIDKALLEWQETPCRKQTIDDPNYTGNAYNAWECWGDPCWDDTDCAAGSSCKNYGTQMTAAKVDCSTICTDGTCDCVRGKCSKLKKAP
jgi:hypothetical protein